MTSCKKEKVKKDNFQVLLKYYVSGSNPAGGGLHSFPGVRAGKNESAWPESCSLINSSIEGNGSNRLALISTDPIQTERQSDAF